MPPSPARARRSPAPEPRAPGPSLLRRRKEQTRDEIALAAAELFSARGYDSTTVEEIAAAAGVSPRTFFRYFPRKEDVATAFGGRALHWIAGYLEARPPQEPLDEAMRGAVAAGLAEAKAGPRQRMLMALLAKVPALRARWLEDARSNQDRLAAVVARRLGLAATSLEPRLVAACHVAMIQTIWEMWAEGHEPRPLVARALEALAHGLHREGAPRRPRRRARRT
jgi:AcrR family transcriptional regulator